MPAPWVSRVDKQFTKKVTFDGGSGSGATGTVAIGTVAGAIMVTGGAVRCTTDLTSSGGTLSLGVSGNVDGLIPTTLASDIDQNEFWHDAQPLSKIAPAMIWQAICASLILTVGTANITAGVLEIVLYYRSVSIDTPGTLT